MSTAAEGTTATMVNWQAVIMKTTIEEDNHPFATAKEPRTVNTTRIWYVNLAVPEAMRYLKELPEN